MTHRLITTEHIISLVSQNQHDILSPYENNTLCIQIMDLSRVDHFVIKDGTLAAHPSVDNPSLTIRGNISDFDHNMPLKSFVVEGSAPMAKALLEHIKTIRIQPPEMLNKVIPTPFNEMTHLAFTRIIKWLSRQLAFIQNSLQDGP
jgi:hypothetical protein